jgi:hypothetical protein|tara:strand:+ start:852 stop:1028 length:177 start_codon:yes stop_codon:yes gene_type:complete
MWPSGPDPAQLIGCIVLYPDNPCFFIAQVPSASAVALAYSTTGLIGSAFKISWHNLDL